MTRVVTGDSFSSQHSAKLHFGLGGEDKVNSIEITWADGSKEILDSPSIQKYHTATFKGGLVGRQAER